MTSLDDFILALDTYMANKGNGANYLASKIADVFESKDSPFNVKDGPLKELSKMFKTFSDEIKTVVGYTHSIAIELTDMLTQTHLFNQHLNRVTHLLSNFKLPSVSVRVSAPAVSSPLASASLHGGGIIPVLITNKGVADPFFKSLYVGTVRFFQKNAINSKILSFNPFALDQLKTALGNVTNPILTHPPASSASNIVNNYHTTNVLPDKTKEKKEEKGFFRKLFDGILLIFGGAYLLGKLKQWMDTSEMGKSVKANIKSFVNYIFESISGFIKSGDMKGTMSSAANFVKTIFVTLYEGIKKVIVDNKKELKDILKGIGSFIKNKIINPLFSEINSVITNIPWMKYGEKFISLLWTKVIIPFGKSLFSDLSKGDFGSAVLKALEAIFLVKLIPSITKLIPVIGTVSTALGTTLGGAFVALGAIVYSTYKIVQYLTDDFKTYKEAQEALHNSLMAANKTLADNKKRQDERIKPFAEDLATRNKNLKEKYGSDETQYPLEERLKRTLDILQIERKKTDDEYNKNIKELLDKQSSLWTRLSEIPFIGAKTNDERIGEMMGDQGKRYTAFSKTIDAVNKELKNLEEEKKKTPVNPVAINPVNDAIIVEPHSKDQVIAGKKDGPFDMFFKDMSHKFDKMIDIMIEGYSTMVNATMSSGNSVAQAVVSTANSGGGNTTGGGVDQISQYRNRLSNHFER